MQELEKIMEEIEQKKEKCLNVVKMEIDPMEITIHREQYKGLCMAEESIRKHMNDGWIPVEERLPEDGTYLCTLDGELCGTKEPFTGMCGIENGIWDEPDCVIAWCHLPEPYRPERSEEDHET